MAILTVADARARLAAAVGALSGWKESSWPAGLFGREPDTRMHLAFAVGLPTTTAINDGQRQRSAEHVRVETVAVVHWAHRLRQDNAVTAMGEALAAEADLIQAVHGMSRADLHVLIRRTRRNDSTEGWFLGELEVSLIHRVALS